MAFPNTTAFPGPGNVYIPTFGGTKANAKLIVSFARDPKKFAVNGLATRTPTETMAGYWEVLRPEVLARLFQTPNSYIWVDGQPFPSGNHNQQDFRAMPYQCQRLAIPNYLGNQTKEQAVWDIEQTQLDVLGHMMMTLRAKVYYTLMLNPVNYLPNHVFTAQQWSSQNGATGGGWQQGTAQNPIIYRTLKNMANQIRKDTMATTTYKDLTLVIDPDAAIIMGGSEEIHWYLAQQSGAIKQIMGDNEQNGEWGLPKRLYDMNLIVDPTLQTISGRLVVPGTTTDIMDYNTALVVAAPGALSSNIGQVNSGFSTTHMFVYKGQEMVVKTQYQQWDEFTKYGIYETYAMSIVSPETCALATSLFV